jgi:hypothetical protein
MSSRVGGQLAVSEPRSDIVLKTFAFLLAAPLAYLTVNQALLQWHYRMRLPVWDMINIISLLDGNPSRSVNFLYHAVRDNEHRPIVSFLFYLWDRNYFHDSGELLYAAIFLANSLLVASLLGILVAMRDAMSLAYRVLLGVTVTLNFFAIFHYENLTWQKQIHEISCMLFLSVGLLFSAMVSNRDDAKRNNETDTLFVVLSGVLCLAATYSFGFGIVTWPVVIVHALLRGWKPWPLAVFAAIAVFAVVSYALTYIVLGQHTNPVSAISDPIGMIVYALHVIGAPFYYIFEDRSSVGVVAGLTSFVGLIGFIVAGVWIGLLYLARKRDPIPLQLRFISFHASMLICASVGMAILVALGRLTVNIGFESRYAIVGSLFWTSLLLLLVSSLRRRAANFTILVFGGVALAAAYLPAQRYETKLRVQEQTIYQAGVLATYRLAFWPRMPALHPDPATLFQVWFAQRAGGSFSQREPFKWIGNSILNLPPAPVSSRCLAYIEAVTRLDEDSRVAKVAGMAFIASKDTRLRWIVITDESGNGVGVGVPGLKRIDARNHFNELGIDENFDGQNSSGFEIAIVNEPGEKIQLWGIDLEGRACRLSDLKPP